MSGLASHLMSLVCVVVVAVVVVVTWCVQY